LTDRRGSLIGSVIATVAKAPNKQILQLNALPVTITAARYANAFSSANPSGSLSTAYALRLLIDPIPDFTHY
jgi:hypothetical protein